MMKFSIEENNNKKLMIEADEIIFNNPISIVKNISFIKENPNKRYVIKVDDIDTIKEVKNKINKYLKDSEWAVCASSYYLLFILSTDEFFNKKFYFDYPIIDLSELDLILKLNVSDVIINEELGFNIDFLKQIKELYKVNIRVNPTYSFLSDLYNTSSYTNFFIRPEDLELYEGAIDYVFFTSHNISIQEKQFEIYKNGKFNGEIRDLSNSIKFENILNPFIPRDFSVKRLNCSKKCLKEKMLKGYSKCNFCEEYLALAKNISLTILNKE